MTVREVRKVILDTIRDSVDTDAQITEQTDLIRTLGLTSVETMMLISDLEDRFGIDFPSAKLRNVWTVGNLCDIIISELQ